MLPRIISIILSATSSWTKSTRSAEQRWPALSKALARTSRATCSGSAVESTIIAFWPPVSAISVAIGPLRPASARLIAVAASVEPVKATPQSLASPNSALPMRGPSPGRKCSTSFGTPASCSSRTAAAAISGVLLRGLGEHAVARRQRARDLAGEDGERKVPRRDAGEDAAAVQRHHIALAGRPGQRRLFREQHAAALGIIAQEVDRLAHLAQRVGERLARLAHGKRHQLGAVRLVEIGGTLQDAGARIGAELVPFALRLVGAGERVARLRHRSPRRWRRRCGAGRTGRG